MLCRAVGGVEEWGRMGGGGGARGLIRVGGRIVYTAVHNSVVRDGEMETQKVGIREFRDKLASYVLESKEPIAITRHGDTVGLYIPVRRKPTDAEWAALEEAHARVQQMMLDAGVTEDELMDDIKRLRAADRK
jgi:antitoxin (DNA-binding transcriptional repressor) of toxin-antitoxin stability system